jgi:hypothetical protein
MLYLAELGGDYKLHMCYLAEFGVIGRVEKRVKTLEFADKVKKRMKGARSLVRGFFFHGKYILRSRGVLNSCYITEFRVLGRVGMGVGGGGGFSLVRCYIVYHGDPTL